MNGLARRRRPLVLLTVISLAGCATAITRAQPQAARSVVPTPESQGVESGALADAIDAALKQQLPIHALLLTRHGTTVLDASFNPFREEARHDIASITKSITSLLVGIAVHSGKLRGANVTLGEVFPGTDPAHARIRIVDLLGMQSGMECGSARGEAELRAMMQSRNWVEFALHIPMRTTPGTEIGYCSPNYHILSAILSRVTGRSEAEFARDALFRPLGITDIYWPSDPQGVTHGWGDLQLRPADLVKIGQLMLQGGEWNGIRIVSREWIQWSTTSHVQFSGNDYYAYGWWTHPDAPPGFFEAIGRGGQRLSVVPGKDAVVVMLGGGYEPGILGGHLLQSLASDTALSPVTETTARLARSVNAARTRDVDEPQDYVPACADAVSGRTYRMESNSLGLQTFRLDRRGDGTMHLQLADRSLELPMRKDGRFAMAKKRIDGITPMSRGSWKAPCTLTFALDLLGKIDHYTLDITFEGAGAAVTLVERTGLMRETAHAALAAPR
jgi:CubicO group peptidase (beta-lactamase class C family)